MGIASAALGCFRKQHKCASLSPILPSVFYTMSALSAPAGHLPLEGKATMRESHLLNRWHTTLVNLSAPQAPSSRAQPSIFIALPPYAHMRPHSNDTLVLPFSPSPTHGLPVCKKDPSTSALMTRMKDDRLTSSFIPLRRVVPLRGTLSCAFVAPLLQGATRIIGVTGD